MPHGHMGMHAAIIHLHERLLLQALIVNDRCVRRDESNALTVAV